MRTLLLYNPRSGRNQATRAHTIQAIAHLFTAHGHQVHTEPTTAPGSAAEQARSAITQGFELILACGGDGTVHDTLQGIIDPPHPEPRVTLGVLPMGSANALARHLGLSTDPVAAARQLLSFAPRLVPVGHIQTPTHTRYFTVMVGAGPDGALVSTEAASRKHAADANPLPAAKLRLGRLAYYLRAATLFATRPFPAFELHWTDASTGLPHTTRAVATMAVRIDSLGGLFHRLAPSAAVDHPHLSLIAVRPPGWIGLPAWFAGSWLGLRRRTPLVLHVHATDFTITPVPTSPPIHLQADGEHLSHAPAHIRLLPNALRLLMPPE